MRRTTTRVAALAVALLSLLAGGLVAVAPAGSAEDDVEGRSPHHRGILENDVHVDMRVPEIFYPHDDYEAYIKNWLTVRIFESPSTEEEMNEIHFSVANSSGTVLREEAVSPAMLNAYGKVEVAWDGRRPPRPGESRGGLYPEGTYTITVRVTDSSNDSLVLTGKTKLDHAYLHLQKWRRTVRPADTIIDKAIGRCGWLRKPARAGWRGSLGYRTSACADLRQSYASVAHGIYLPVPKVRWYTDIRLLAYGGTAKGHRRGGLVYHYLGRGGRWIGGTRFGPRLEMHRGWHGGRTVVLGGRDGERPHFIWNVSVRGGRGYDVRRYKVVAVHYVFD